MKYLLVLACFATSAQAGCFLNQPLEVPFLERLSTPVERMWLPHRGDHVFVTFSGGGVHELNRFISEARRDVFGVYPRIHATREEAREALNGYGYIIVADRYQGAVVSVERADDGQVLSSASCEADWH